MTSKPPDSDPDSLKADGQEHSGWDTFFERIADIPWGVLLVLILIGLLVFGRVKGDDVQTIRALATN